MIMCNILHKLYCTADYLLGREDDLGNVNVMRELTDDEKLLLSVFSKLSKKQREEALNFIDYVYSKG